MIFIFKFEEEDLIEIERLEEKYAYLDQGFFKSLKKPNEEVLEKVRVYRFGFKSQK